MTIPADRYVCLSRPPHAPHLTLTFNKNTRIAPVPQDIESEWWLRVGSNHRPQHYECCALIWALAMSSPHVLLWGHRTRRVSRYGSHQGTRVPWSRLHKSMICRGDSGPARTRTWDQGIMSTRIPLSRRPKAEDVEALFRCPSRPTVSTEPVPNPGPKPGGASRGKIDPDHRVARPNRQNRGRTAGVGRAWGGGGRGAVK
jgi:hypothetical protein